MDWMAGNPENAGELAMTELVEITFLVIAVLLVLSVVASKVTDRFGVPALVLFLILGMLAGSEGVGGIYFDDPQVAQAIGLFALAIILFSGGLDTEWESIRYVIKEAISLATVGVLITAFVLGYAAHLILGITLLEGLLLGAITSSTDAAAVFALLRSHGVNLKNRLLPLLEFESGSNDPMAVFLTIGLVQLIQAPDQSIFSLVLLFFQQMIIGGVLGVIFGRLLLYLINRLRLGYEGLYPVLVLGVLLLTFSITSLIRGSGFLAVYLVGLQLGRTEFLHKRSVSRFYQGLAWLSQIIMFLALGLLVFPSRLIPVLIPGMILAAILILIARPISVWISLLPFRFTGREKTFISWVGLRGAVPIVLATYPRLAGLDQSGVIFDVIFFVVLTSVLIQGTSIVPIAKWLKLDDPVEKQSNFPLELTPLRGWHGVLQELVVAGNSPVVGKAIYEMHLPRDFLVVLISREDKFLIPNGSIVLQPNDRILGLASPEAHRQVTHLIERSTEEMPGIEPNRDNRKN
jgi:potassium/hydrogen antiporter